MSEFKGTPGPWFVDPMGIGSLGDVSTKDGDAVAQAQQTGPGPSGFDAKRTANARLIAACPTMYQYIEDKALAGDTEATKILEGINASF